MGAGLVHLVGADHEVLAQHRGVDRRPHLVQVGERAAEPALLRQPAAHPGPSGPGRAGAWRAARTRARPTGEPPTRRPSGSTLITRAPPAWYCRASSAGEAISA